jgi:hypothetical protein
MEETDVDIRRLLLPFAFLALLAAPASAQEFPPLDGWSISLAASGVTYYTCEDLEACGTDSLMSVRIFDRAPPKSIETDREGLRTAIMQPGGSVQDMIFQPASTETLGAFTSTAYEYLMVFVPGFEEPESVHWKSGYLYRSDNGRHVFISVGSSAREQSAASANYDLLADALAQAF